MLLLAVVVRLLWPHEQPDVLVIIWDTVRADRVTALTAPRLQARSGRRYKQAISPAIWTLPGHASLFTGLPVRSHGAYGHHGLSDVETLAERFEAAGYATFLYSSNPFVAEVTGLTRGFQHVETSWDPTRRERLLYRGAAIGPAYENWATGQQRPTFAVLNFMEAHAPLLPSFEARKRLDDPYDAAIWDLDRYTDALLGQHEGIAVVISDHGELFGEHGIEGHHGGLWEPLLHVPFYVFGPGIEGTVMQPTSTADLGRVLALELGWEAPSPVPPVAERRGWEPLEEKPEAQLSVRRGGLKWIEGVGVFDLAADPGEAHPLPGASTLERARAEFEAAWPDEDPGAPAVLTHEFLEGLGYVDPG